MNSELILAPVSKFSGVVALPGSKSLANRALLLAALARGTTLIDNLPDGDDVRYMLQALRILGIHCNVFKGDTAGKIFGCAGRFPTLPISPLFLGNAGTVMRPLSALLSLDCWHGTDGASDQPLRIVTGDARMQMRPIGPLVDALRQGGAKIEYLGMVGYPPLGIRGGFQGGEITVSGDLSSQFLTALLIATPLAKKASTIAVHGQLVSQPYVQMTLQLIRHFGVVIEQRSDRQFYVPSQQQYVAPSPMVLEGDAGAASYFLAAAAIKGGPVRITGIGRHSLQGEAHCAAVLERMGAKISWGESYIECRRGSLQGIDIDMNEQPDTAMTVATVALFAKGASVIRNIHHWRFKESDRLRAMATELRKVGAIVEEGTDFIRIIPPAQLQAARINTYNDHRMAMCFSLVALANKTVTLSDPTCVSKSFPNYFAEWAKLTAH